MSFLLAAQSFGEKIIIIVDAFEKNTLMLNYYIIVIVIRAYLM